MTIAKTGYEQDNQGAWIRKDPTAQLVYSLDWTDWLAPNDSLLSATYSLQVRSNDPIPLIKVGEGVTQQNTVSFVEIAGGQTGKIYTVTATITTASGSIDSRSFRIKIEDRSA